MTWPTANISTANLDSAAGSISSSRQNIYAAIVALNEIIQASTGVYTQSNVTTYTPNYALGPVHSIQANTGLTLDAPTNLPLGHSMELVIRQATTTASLYVASGYVTAGYFQEGAQISANSQYLFRGGLTTLSGTAPSVDRLTVQRTGTTEYLADLDLGYI